MGWFPIVRKRLAESSDKEGGKRDGDLPLVMQYIGIQ